AAPPPVAGDAVVPHPDVEVVVPMGVRLAEADAAGEEAAVVLEDIVGDLNVVDVGLELDPPCAVAAPGLKAEAVDAGTVERGAVLAGGQGWNVIGRCGLGDRGDVSATH